MKNALKMLIIVVVFSLFTIPASASDADKYLDEFGGILPDGYSGIVEDSGSLTEAVGLRAILSELGAAIEGRRGEIASFFLLSLGCAVLVSAASLFDGALMRCGASGVGMICSLALFASMIPLFSETRAALESMSSFFSSSLPILLALTAASGGATTASVGAVGMNITLALLGSIGGGVFIAVSSLSFALCLISSLGGEGISSLVRGLKSFFTWTLGIVTAVLTGTLALQTVISSAADSMAMRTAKYMASGMIPVVGGTVSGALSTLLSGLEYAGSVIGIGSVLVIVTIALAPLAVLLLYRLALSLSIGLLEFVGASVKEPFSAFRYSLDTLIATYCISVIIYVFEIILFLKGGVQA